VEVVAVADAAGEYDHKAGMKECDELGKKLRGSEVEDQHTMILETLGTGEKRQESPMPSVPLL